MAALRDRSKGKGKGKGYTCTEFAGTFRENEFMPDRATKVMKLDDQGKDVTRFINPCKPDNTPQPGGWGGEDDNVGAQSRSVPITC